MKMENQLKIEDQWRSGCSGVKDLAQAGCSRFISFHFASHLNSEMFPGLSFAKSSGVLNLHWRR
jgi:hypothetical protein